MWYLILFLYTWAAFVEWMKMYDDFARERKAAELRGAVGWINGPTWRTWIVTFVFIWLLWWVYPFTRKLPQIFPPL